MTQESVELLIPFESLVKSVTKLRLRDKFRLWELLDEQMAHAEEKKWEEDPSVKAEIQEARDAYQAGDYVTLHDLTPPHNTPSLSLMPPDLAKWKSGVRD